MFIGEYHHNIDENNLLVVSFDFYEEIKRKYFVTKLLDSCLYVYNKVINKLNTLSFTKKDARTFIKFFLSSATVCEFDKQGSVSLLNTFIKYSSIKKKCMVIMVGDLYA